MWNLVVAVILYNYLAYIAWSFRIRLEDGSAYGVIRQPQTGEYIFGVSSELYRASSLIHHRPQIPMLVVYARPFGEYLHSKVEPALGMPLTDRPLETSRQEAVLGRAAWPAPVSSVDMDGHGLSSDAMEAGRDVDYSSSDDMYSLEIVGLSNQQIEERLN
ncbi:hypothetical protein GUITHDRAFT_104284 [Guillardia theta CCMP2712]|uniref:Uncharacterized protein n=1 Tax=Guillardia theta (strain CCMP2712) TaxID=905079 RepID=L1JN73_GUITC|nr:hypothetical protein GUITHDRAFT_104284 [Guillardia theta CCMP2712]EKX49887.1 hypothetical protein GUITHDRAFT_104284 [Guillardia theta CCMP2712]|eukprot:XP_005836867.1 hypothetical protein GUITHDRAFT_104284 [Guillardia theta CCMP2712]